MKIINTTITIFEFDESKELIRLKSCFKGSQLKRQLDLFNAFMKSDFDKVNELYYNLPYCSRGGCPEQEYVGTWFHMIFSNANWRNAGHVISSSRKCVIEIE